MPWTFSKGSKNITIPQESPLEIACSYAFPPAQSGGGNSGSTTPIARPTIVGYDIIMSGFPKQVTSSSTATLATVSAKNLIGLFEVTIRYQDLESQTHFKVDKFEDVPNKGSIAIYQFLPPSVQLITLPIRIRPKFEKPKFGSYTISDLDDLDLDISVGVTYNLDSAVHDFKTKLALIESASKA